MTPEDFAVAYNVPRETMAKFSVYADMLADWQTRMNLVGPATLPQTWERHFADSAQLLPLAPQGATWLDLGAGAGFPGLVIALLDPKSHITLVESLAKKCRFLTAVANELGLQRQILIANQRIEKLPPHAPQVITARALAPLSQLFRWGLPHAKPDTIWLLPKGARYADELVEAEARFCFRHEEIQSRTSPDGRIIKATGVARI